MKAFIFFSVHEELFHRVAVQLHQFGVTSFSGFVWSEHQERELLGRGVSYDPILVFTRDFLPQCDDGKKPDIAWLQRREQELGISISRMLAAERHLLANRSFDQVMRMAEVALREIAAAYDRIKPDFAFTEDVSCFHSYVHFVLARERGIPFWCISRARLPGRISVYSSGLQHWERVEQTYNELIERGLTPREAEDARDYVETFRNKPVRPSGMDTRAKLPRLELTDLRRLGLAVQRYFGDRRDPTAAPPMRVIQRRLTRIARIKLADSRHLWEVPDPDEKYVFYPIHVQPEASTLVQAPLYVDQVALIEDMAKSLPIGYRLYVKEHVSSKGRRPLEYYERIRSNVAVRLLGPDADTWSLIRNASAIAVITGTVGWEGLLFGKPVVTFGDVFFNIVPDVFQARHVAKDGWHDVFKRAVASPPPNPEAVLALVAALHQATYPGFIGNPNTFPKALDVENVAQLAQAIAAATGLAPI